MVEAGVEAIRVRFDWATAQRWSRPAAVPPAQRSLYRRVINGVPTSFHASDRVVAAAARRKIEVLPVVLGAPAWDMVRGTQVPRGTRAFSNYMAALIGRYGPRGSFWRENPSIPKRPIRTWQVWNEPPFYWKPEVVQRLPAADRGTQDPAILGNPDRAFAGPYVRLVRAVHAAVKRRDPGAKIVLAGLFGVSWEQLDAVYSQPGAKAAFEVVAVHPFTREVRNVVLSVERVRAEMRENGDAHKPIWITELTWPAAAGKVERFGYEVTRRQQAQRLTAAYTAFIKRRHSLKLQRIYWHTWVSRFTSTVNPFDYSGLRRGNAATSRPNDPAYRAYQRLARRYEGCAKTRVANVCRR
jgi:hypothetical protein